MNIHTIVKFAALSALVALPSIAHAGYTANFIANLTWVGAYRGGNVCVGYSNPPPGCGAYLCTTGSTEGDANRIYSRSLTAFSTGKAMNIGYDSVACAAGGIIYKAG